MFGRNAGAYMRGSFDYNWEMPDDAVYFDCLRSTRIFQGGDLPELGTVLNGTKCGDEMVSMAFQKRRCVSI
jgi:hypothetical protein